MRILEICVKIYQLGSAKFLSFPSVGWQAAFKKSKVKLDK